jgi:hypothetical protein
MPSTCREESDIQPMAPVRAPHMHQDAVMYLIYSGGAVPLLRALIAESVRNIAEDFPSDGVRAALQGLAPPPDASVSCLRVRFFLLLNQDYRMRMRLCGDRVAGHLPPLCLYKACGLYEQLHEALVPRWLRDERITLLDFSEQLKDAYLAA